MFENVNDYLNVIWILVILSFLIPVIQKRMLAARRISTIQDMERKRKTRVITMIHRQEVMSFFGIPLARYIDIEDSEAVLRAIRMTPPEMPIDLVLHTPGGLVLASEQIACALKRHKGKVTVFVPHYAMSGGTLVAMAANEIIMDPNAVLGPVDPQVGYFPAVSILKALEQPNPNRDDQTLIFGDVARKAIDQVYNAVYTLLLEKHGPEKAKELAKMLSEGRWTHDYPIDFDQAKEMGLPVNEDMQKEVYDLMELYPQAGLRRPSVEYVPVPYVPPARAPSKGR
jgi:ClpP class serine protease